MEKPAAARPIAEAMPPLILGTGTFNHQFNTDPNDPASLPALSIVRRALELGVTAFDTSPYYGPSETILGAALTHPSVSSAFPRPSYFLITKAGRVAPTAFDYSPAGIRASIERSLQRLGTDYLDLVYCHDVEFVSEPEILAALSELRSLRALGKIRYVGVSAYTLSALSAATRAILQRTGEPVDAVLSYGHYTIQNHRLSQPDLLRDFRDAGVSVLGNASMLGMGLLTTRGIDAAPMAVWHPAPPELRKKCHDLNALVQAEFGGKKTLEDVAITYSMASWAEKAASAGLGTKALLGQSQKSTWKLDSIGVNVMGVSSVAELEATVRAWESVIAEDADVRHAVSFAEQTLVPSLGSWLNYSWDSPEKGFVNTFKSST